MITYTRQDGIFDNATFNKAFGIDIIGAGAIGSHITYLCAKMGCSKIRVFDYDSIEPHNVSNQIFRKKDVGRLKVEALREIVQDFTDCNITSVAEKITPDSSYEPREIVFLAIDSMTGRKEIYETFLKRSLAKWMIESRMGRESSMVYTIRPALPSHSKGWLAWWYPDEAAETSVCGSSFSVAYIAADVAATCVGQMVLATRGDVVANSIIKGYNPCTITTDNF